MTLLLDTHALLWFVLNDPSLSTRARTAIEEPANAICISPASYWEIAIKISCGKYQLNRSYETFWKAAVRDNGISILPVQIHHTSRLTSMPFHHRDPFDRLLIAQALAEDLPLVSADSIFDQYGLQRVW